MQGRRSARSGFQRAPAVSARQPADRAAQEHGLDLNLWATARGKAFIQIARGAKMDEEAALRICSIRVFRLKEFA